MPKQPPDHESQVRRLIFYNVAPHHGEFHQNGNLAKFHILLTLPTCPLGNWALSACWRPLYTHSHVAVVTGLFLAYFPKPGSCWHSAVSGPFICPVIMASLPNHSDDNRGSNTSWPLLFIQPSQSSYCGCPDNNMDDVGADDDSVDKENNTINNGALDKLFSIHRCLHTMHHKYQSN